MLRSIARDTKPLVGIDDIEQVYAYGVLYAARALWEALDWAAAAREDAAGRLPAPHDTALLAMTANRLADDVYWPEAKALALEPL